MMYCKVEKMIETMDKVVEKTLHLVTPDSLKYMDSDNLEMLQLSLRKSRRKLLKPRRNSLIVSKRNWINCYPQQIRLGLKKPLSFVFAIFSIPLMEKQLAQLGEHSTSEGSWVRAPHCFF